MTISAVFLQSELPSGLQQVFLVILALFVPPLPIYLMSKPNYTVKTKEFLISCVLTLTLGLVGSLYTIILILSIFPEARANASRQGYIRVGDAESQPEGATETSHQSGDIRQNVVEEAQEIEAHKPYTDIPGKDQKAVSEPALPTYEESEGNSKGDKRDDMVKFGDNKIQH